MLTSAFSSLSRFESALIAVGESQPLEMLAADAVGEVDEEGLVKGKPFRIFKFGQVPTEKGTFTVPKALASMIAQNWKDRGNDMQIDYEHGLVKTPPGQPVRTAGWCKVELRNDGLFATDVRWTTEAFGLIKKREYKYISPLFGHTESKVVTSLENVAITVDPATHKLEKLLAASADGASNVDELTILDVVLKDLTAADLPALQAHLAKQHPTLTTALSGDGKEKHAMKTKLAKFIKGRMDEHEMEPDELAKECRMETSRLQKLASGEEKPSDEEMGRLAKALRCKASHMSKLATEAEEQEPAGKAAGAPGGADPSKSEVKEVYKEGASAKDVPAKGENDKPAGFPKEGLTALAAGLTDPAQKGMLVGLIAAAENVTALAAQVGDLTKRLEARDVAEKQSEHERLVQTGLESGQISPAMQEWAKGVGVEELKGYLSVAPRVGPGKPAAQQPSAGKISNGAGADMRAIREVAALRGKTPAAVLKAHEARTATEAQRRKDELLDA